ncbi:Amino acid transporter [Vibrio coralliirubri]|uniref:LysE/ArgO family amino acid transporter n=1 Tax=Vibrio coralliirubri TaxID=1516159 RepID=UPI000635414B|nr:LysE/ArgO family amino acid transporter [Vibrio coralliirubri]CDT33539.1 Amino acid transporter [Vibrio coralliirubri]
MSIALFQGAALGISMIVPIGAQNSFLISQGIKKQHHVLAAFICAMCDVVLTISGVYGGSHLISSSDLLLYGITVSGIIFLLTYASISLFRACKFEYDEFETTSASFGRKAIILSTLAVTLLNPHVYLDTVVILGSVGATYEDLDKIYFVSGAIFSAFVWFFGVVILAARLSSLLSKPRVQQSIDIVVAAIMYMVSYKLFVSTFG